jgi:ribonuclease G
LKKQVLVSVDRGETRVALLESTGTPGAAKTGRRRGANPAAGYRVAELYFERRGNRSIVGNIYKGKVDNVLPGLAGAARRAARRSATCSSPGRRSSCRSSRTR